MPKKNKDTALAVADRVDWLGQVLDETGASGFIVGLSGGVDSSVAANLIKQAAPERSLAVILPCESNQQDEKDALAVIKQCGIRYCKIDLTDVFVRMSEQLKNDLRTVPEKPVWQEDFYERAAFANLKARLRMSTIYFLANGLNYLVVGTDNAAELYTGYFTKYGDGGCDLLPLADLLKSEVYQWAEYLGVPESIINKAPSAGLYAEQTDEKEMGTTYRIIDDFLSGEKIPEADMEIIENLHKRSEHKRHMPRRPGNEGSNQQITLR